MKVLILLVFTSILSLSSSAHEFYFGYAEFEWNDFSRTFQGTLIVTGHDLELALDQKLMENDLTGPELDKLMSYINKHLVIGDSHLNYVGFESKLTGEFYLYLETDQMELAMDTPLTLNFSIMMDTYTDQQNKMSLTYHGRKHHLVFLNKASKTNEIILSENDTKQ